MAKHNAVCEETKKRVVAYYINHPEETGGEIGERFGVSRTSISKWALEMGHRRQRPQRYKAKTNWKIVDPLIGTRTLQSISEEFDIDPHALTRRRKELGISQYAYLALQRKDREMDISIAGPHVKLWDGWKRPKGMLEYINEIQWEKRCEQL